MFENIKCISIDSKRLGQYPMFIIEYLRKPAIIVVIIDKRLPCVAVHMFNSLQAELTKSYDSKEGFKEQ